MFGHSANITLWISACIRPEPPHHQMLIQIEDDYAVQTLRDLDVIYIDSEDDKRNPDWFPEESDEDGEGHEQFFCLEDTKYDNEESMYVASEDLRHRFGIPKLIDKGKRRWKSTGNCDEPMYRYSAAGYKRTRGPKSRGGELVKKRKEEAERRRGISWETGSEPSQGYPPWK